MSERVCVRIRFAIKQVRKKNTSLFVGDKLTLLYVHCVDNVQVAADLFIRKYFLLLLAKHGQVSVVSIVLPHRPSDAIAQ